MQKTIIYLRVNGIAGSIVDAYCNTAPTSPSVIRGLDALLAYRLFHADGTPYTVAELSEIVSWDFVAADDFDLLTEVQLRSTGQFIVVSISEDNYTGAEIQVPLTDTNTTQLIAKIGTGASISLGTELLGFIAGNTKPVLAIQSSLTVYNRRSGAGTGTPEQVDDGEYTAAQVDALLCSAREYQYSVDGTSWHSTQVVADRYYQERYPGGEWSASIALVVGPEGKAATVEIGTVTDLEPGNAPTVLNSGTTNAAVLNFGLVKGKAATITVSSVDLLDYGTAPYVVNDGTSSAAVLRIGIPRAPNVIVQYSINGIAWDSAATDSTIWMRISTDGGTTWQTAWRCRGFNGLGYTPRGAYNAATTYATDEVVTYNGSLYASIIDSNTGNLPTDTNYWLRIVAGSGQASITIFDTIALRDAYVPAATGELAFVRDATGDNTVASGSAEYLWDGVNSVWIKVFEAESLDVVLSFAHLTGEVADNAKMVAALAAKVNTSTTVNGHALTGNITVTASDLSLAAVASSGSATDLTTGTLPAARLPASGAVAGTYGSGTAIPTVKVDASGRVIEITSTSITVGSCDAPAAASVATASHGLPLTVKIPVVVGGNDSNTGVLLDFEDASLSNTAVGTTGGALTTTGVRSSSTCKFGAYSLYRSSTSTTATIPVDLGSGDFTVEFWYYYLGDSGEYTLFSYTSDSSTTSNFGWVRYGTWAYVNNAYNGTSGGSWIPNLNDLSGTGVWRHVAVVRYSGILTFYINGVSQYSCSNTTSYGAGILRLGQPVGTWNGLIGYIDEVRVSKVARWTAAFTPPTAAYDAADTTPYYGFPDASTDAITGAERIAVANSDNTPVTHTVREIVGATPINAQTGTSYTLALTDQGKLVTMTNSAANTLTIPLNSSVAYPVGAWIDVLNLGAGACTVTAASGATLNGTSAGTRAMNQYEKLRLTQTAANVWTVQPVVATSSGLLIASGNGYVLSNGTIRGAVGAKSISLEYGNSGNSGATGQFATTGGGYESIASGQSSTVGGGSQNTASGIFSVIPGGSCATAYHYAEFAIASGAFSAIGDCQRGSVQVRKSTTATTATILYSGGDSGSSFGLNTSDHYSCRVYLLGAQADGSTGDYLAMVKIKNVSGTTSLSGTVRTIAAWEGDTNLGTPTIAITADTTNNALQIAVTPANSTATRWTAVIEYVKINY